VNKPIRFSVKPEAPHEPQLVLGQIALAAGSEWEPRLPGWLVVQVSCGVGYWLHRSLNRELETGAMLLFSDQVRGCFLASQVGELHLQFFRVEPSKLTGLITMADQRILESAAGDEKLALRILPPNIDLAGKFKKIGAKETAKTLPARAQMLQIFLEVFAGDFRQAPLDEAEMLDAKDRLRATLNETLVDDVAEIDFSELVNKTGCSPRHVSRLFTELVGVSFREKQTELRLARACELLASTDSKVAVVALESGYQSTSFFNLMFKQRFGVNPTKWREQVKRSRAAKRVVKRWQVLA
jgi:AraC-like DNA-binding protein